MDICMPNQTEWLRISADMAKAEKGALTIANEEETRKKINSFMANMPPLSGANSIPIVDDGVIRNIWNGPATAAATNTSDENEME